MMVEGCPIAACVRAANHTGRHRASDGKPFDVAEYDTPAQAAACEQTGQERLEDGGSQWAPPVDFGAVGLDPAYRALAPKPRGREGQAMTETLAQWEQRCREQKVTCPVCGAAPNAWCIEHHLSYANAAAIRMLDAAQEYSNETFTFSAAWQQRPTEKENDMQLPNEPAAPGIPALPPTEVDGPTSAVQPEPSSDGSGPTFIPLSGELSAELSAELSSDRGRTFVSEPDGLPGQGFEGALPGELNEKEE